MKARNWAFLIICTALPAFALALTPPIVTFNRTLKLGDRGSDVVGLQILLNRDPATRIAVSGAGSPNNETEYFGRMTAAAVIRFQEKYRTEVLAPAGLLRGTGIVGVLTRAKLNALSSASMPSTPDPVEPAQPLVIPDDILQPVAPASSIPVTPAAAWPIIESISPTSGGNGTVITISGSNFDATNNTVYASYADFHNVTSPDKKTINITIDTSMLKFKQTPVELPFFIYLETPVGKSNLKAFMYHEP